MLSTIVEAKDYVEDRRHKTWKQVAGSQPLLDESDMDHIEDFLKNVRCELQISN